MRERSGWALGACLGLGMWACASGAPSSSPDDSQLESPEAGTGGAPLTAGMGGKSGSGGSGGKSGSGGSAAMPPKAGTGGSGGSGGSTGGASTDGGVSTDAGSSSTCDDNDKNGKETGTDCGGPDCDPCADGHGCVIDDDCESGYCGSGFVCVAPSCTDKAQNGDETDQDCGGSCSGCADGKMCGDAADCTSGSCDGTNHCACVPITDCGATECGQKADGCGAMVTCSFTCATDETCTNNACVAVPMCDPNSCSNNCTPILQSRCCKSDDTCGCKNTFGGGSCG